MTQTPLPKSHYNAFRPWVEDFEHSTLGKQALRQLETIYGDSTPPLQKRLQEEVLRACYYAFEFWHVGDVNYEKRTLLHDISNLGDHLHDKMAGVINELSLLHFIYDAIMAEGMREMMKETHGELPADPELWGQLRENGWLNIDDLLSNLELYRLGVERLQEGFETLPLRDECWLHGNMRHPERIDGINQHQGIKAATCLMFQLAIFFRLWTHPKGQKLFDKKLNLNIPKEGIAMPKEGMRHDTIISAFINATFTNKSIKRKTVSGEDQLPDEPSSKASVRARIEKIDPRMRLVLWTDESFDLKLKISAKTFDAFLAKHTQKTA